MNKEMLAFKETSDADCNELYGLMKKKILRYEDPTVVDMKELLESLRNDIELRLPRIRKVVMGDRVLGYYSMRNQVDGTVMLEDLSVYPDIDYNTELEILRHCMEEADGQVYRYLYIADIRQVRLYEESGFHLKRRVSPTRGMMIADPVKRGRSL